MAQSRPTSQLGRDCTSHRIDTAVSAEPFDEHQTTLRLVREAYVCYQLAQSC